MRAPPARPPPAPGPPGRAGRAGRPRRGAATGAAGHRPAGPDAASGSASASGSAPGSASASASGTIAAGDAVRVGALVLTALATPGHRPEHLAFAVADTSRTAEPWLVLTGDSLLVGDVARPDLAVAPAEGAAARHDTLAGLLALGDGGEVWPAHVGGSLCGGAGLSHKTSSTIGYERRHNPPVSLAAAAFAESVLASLPCRPPSIERIVELNRVPGHGAVACPPEPPELSPAQLAPLLAAGVTVLDSRSPEVFDQSHLRGAIDLPLASPGLGTRAGWALDPAEPVLVIAADPAALRETVSRLQAVGFWNLAGGSVADPMQWTDAGLAVESSAAWDVDRLAGDLRAGAVELIDVREPAEWREGHVAGSLHLPLARLREVASLNGGEGGRTTAVACAAGVRAAFAASLLRRAGRPDVVRVAGGGIEDLRERGIVLTVGP